MRKPNKPSDLITFRMNSGQFEHCIVVVISENLGKCVSFVNEHTEGKFTEKDFECIGKVFLSQKKCPILWLPTIPKNPTQQATLSHELLHLVFHVCDWAGVALSPSSEEIYTHLLGYYYKQFFSHVHST